MRDAAGSFRTAFQQAQLSRAKGRRLARCVSLVAAGVVTRSRTATTAAREQTWHMLTAVGGAASGLRSVLWHVVGEEQSIMEWCATHRVADHRLSQEQADGAR
jgi:hypothetical protein